MKKLHLQGPVSAQFVKMLLTSLVVLADDPLFNLHWKQQQRSNTNSKDPKLWMKYVEALILNSKDNGNHMYGPITKTRILPGIFWKLREKVTLTNIMRKARETDMWHTYEMWGDQYNNNGNLLWPPFPKKPPKIKALLCRIEEHLTPDSIGREIFHGEDKLFAFVSLNMFWNFSFSPHVRPKLILHEVNVHSIFHVDPCFVFLLLHFPRKAEREAPKFCGIFSDFTYFSKYNDIDMQLRYVHFMYFALNITIDIISEHIIEYSKFESEVANSEKVRVKETIINIPAHCQVVTYLHLLVEQHDSIVLKMNELANIASLFGLKLTLFDGPGFLLKSIDILKGDTPIKTTGF